VQQQELQRSQNYAAWYEHVPGSLSINIIITAFPVKYDFCTLCTLYWLYKKLMRQAKILLNQGSCEILFPRET
jgi:hypothetical protein